MAKLVSKVYGDALFDIALESGKLNDFWEEVKVINVALQENPKLSKLMGHPKIGKEEKIKVIEDIFLGKVSGEILGLLVMLVEKDHSGEMSAVLAYFNGRVKEHKRIGTAYVTTALELSPEKKEAVEKRLLETTKYVKLEMHYVVDATLIGGLVIRIGDRVVDSSVRTKLKNLTRELEKI